VHSEKPPVSRFAERVVHGRDDHGEEEVVTLWIDYAPGAIWRVGRGINIAERDHATPRPEDEVFAGYELGDALTAANEALESDLEASEDNDDRNEGLRPFTEAELKHRLERWFFDHGSPPAR
jgi:hypothetical protein